MENSDSNNNIINNNKNRYNKIILDFFNENLISYEYPRGLEPLITKDEYEQLITELNCIIKNPVSKKYYLLPVAIILFCTFLVFLLLFVDAIDKYTATAFGIMVGIGSVLALVYYYLYKRSENINLQLKQFNDSISKYGIKFIFTLDGVPKKLVANLYYLSNNNNNSNHNNNNNSSNNNDKYNSNNNNSSFNYNDKRSDSNSIRLSSEDHYEVEMDSISNNHNHNSNNHKNEQKQSLLNKYSNNYDEESSSAGAIINDYQPYIQEEEEDESLTI